VSSDSASATTKHDPAARNARAFDFDLFSVRGTLGHAALLPVPNFGFDPADGAAGVGKHYRLWKFAALDQKFDLRALEANIGRQIFFPDYAV
jgi:hypothetical protein